MSEIVISGARVIDPANATDAIGDIHIQSGLVSDKPSEGAPRLDATGLIAVPGLIDLHTHVYVGGTSLGIDPDAYMKSAGVTTSVDAGSAGPGNFAGFRDHVITQSKARILAFLHVSHAGIFGFADGIQVGESENLRLMAPAQAVRIARDHPEVVVGIKVRVGRHASGDQGTAPLDIAIQVAEETGLPLMVHIDEPPPSYEEVIERLNRLEGSILTHAFRPFPNAPIKAGRVVAELPRGYLDIGHGKGSFSFEMARQMLALGRLPDTISSDVHVLCIDGPAYDLPTTMNKFLALGMELEQIIRAVTQTPAEAIRRTDIGHLGTGASGDVTLLAMENGAFPLTDTTGETIVATRRIAVKGVVRAGRVVVSP